MQLSSILKEQLKSIWSLQGEPAFHRRVANFVYFSKLESRDVVLRLTEETHRGFEEIVSELDWMAYLSQGGLKIAAPIRGLDGKFVFKVQDSDRKTYIAALFEKAPGHSLKDETHISHEMIVGWGQFIGQLHKLTRQYKPSAGVKIRQNWETDQNLKMALLSCEIEDEKPYWRMHEVLGWMRSLPQPAESFGLIHCDLHSGNFFVDNNQITAFDFDDSCHHWFIYDLVPALNSISDAFHEGLASDEKNKAFELLLRGYRKHNEIDSIWIKRLEFFDHYRAVMMYHWIKSGLRNNIFSPSAQDWIRQKTVYWLEAMENKPHFF